MIIEGVQKILRLTLEWEARQFEKSFEDCQRTQLKLLNKLCESARHNSFYKFDGSSTYEDFKNISVRSFKDYDFSMCLFGPTLHQEPTSGSGGTKKLIPYNRPLLLSFQKLFRLWSYDLLKTLQLKHGKIFMSVSPPSFGEARGFSDDTQYLDPLWRFLTRRWLVYNPGWKLAGSGDEFLLSVAQELLKCRQLEVVSVWNGRFWLSILETIEQRILKSSSIDWTEVWPHLRLISCWGDAWAQASYEEIKNRHPNTWVQKKGLLATEAPITLPWSTAKAPVPLIQEVFLEFQNGHRILPLWEVEESQTYELIISQKGGLLRYRLGDLVKINKNYLGTPTLDFVGRADQVSDLVGEKLDEAFVSEVLSGFTNKFAILVPSRQNRYVLLCEDEVSSELLDRFLRKSYHYNVARELKQLCSPKVICHSRATHIYHDFLLKSEMKLGDIKESKLFLPTSRALNFAEHLKNLS